MPNVFWSKTPSKPSVGTHSKLGIQIPFHCYNMSWIHTNLKQPCTVTDMSLNTCLIVKHVMKLATEVVSHGWLFWLDKIWFNILTVWPLFPGFVLQWFMHMFAKHHCIFSLQTCYMHILEYGISSSQGREAQRVGYGPPHRHCSRRKIASWYKSCFKSVAAC